MIPLLNTYKEKWQVHSETMIKPGLAAMQQALSQVQHPEKTLQVIHIAGTNGKGSTLTFIEQMALAHGLTVGKFMSPCIRDVHDQIQVNEQPISPLQMDAIFRDMAKAGISGLLTDFELLTCAALLHFARQQVDVVLLEAGMGGRYDSTNVVEPVVSVIPSIALEHTNFLGTTLASIASHKAGIIKEKTPVIVGRLPEEALAVVELEAKAKRARLTVLGREIQVKLDPRGDCYYHHARGVIMPSLQRALLGTHQADNLALALTAFLELADVLKREVNVAAIRKAVTQTTVPGRFEKVRDGLYFDGAHNPASAAMLAETIQTQFAGKRVELVVGMLADKDIVSVLRVLEPVADVFYFVDTDNERAASVHRLMDVSLATEKYVVENTQVFLQQPVDTQVVRIVTGSLYLLSTIRQQLEL